MSDLESLTEEAKEALAAEWEEAMGHSVCRECLRWVLRLVSVKTEDGTKEMCEKCILNYCNCGSYLEFSDEMTAGECRRCMGDAI